MPNLDRLSVSEKDELIRALFAQVAALTAKVTELEGRLALNSQNSSKPPSTDGLNKPKPKPKSKSLRQAGQKPTSGQPGHTGHTLKQVAHPDHIEIHAPPSHCSACLHPLTDGVVVEARQVFDIPPLCYEVTERHVLEARCMCGKVYRGEFPAEVSAPVQYGPRIRVRRRRANAAEPNRAKHSISWIVCVPMPTMSGASWPITTSRSQILSPSRRYACPRLNRKYPAASVPCLGSILFARFAPILPHATNSRSTSSSPSL